MFEECTELYSIDLSEFNTENAESFKGMFKGCRNLVNIKLGKWDTSKVQEFSKY